MPVAVYAPSNITLAGLSLSGRDPVSGLEIVTEDVGGWGSPAPTIVVTQKPRGHGGWSGESFLRARSLALSGYLYADDPNVASTGMDALCAACSLDPVPLVVSENGRVRTMTVRRQDEVIPQWRSPNWVDWSMLLVADDPRRYAPAIAPTTNLASSTGGLTWPITYPITYTGVTVAGIITINNPGNVVAPVTLRIDGPVVGPAVTHVPPSGTATTWGSSYNLIAGNWLTVDMANRRVTENDQSSRNGTVDQRGWFGLDPGLNQFIFTADVYNSTALLTVNTYPGAWL